ncbi:MAG: TonB family protein, partial [Anaerolineae bacterium]|nr:TonB family protein [Gloeobacterales cyanobacterium ES-bin-313]
MQPNSPLQQIQSNVGLKIIGASILASTLLHGGLMLVTLPQPKAPEIEKKDDLIMTQLAPKPRPKMVKPPPPPPPPPPERKVAKNIKQTNAPRKAYASRPIMSSKSDVTGPEVSSNMVSGSRGNGLGTDKGLDPGGTSDKGDPNGSGGNDAVQSPPPPPPPPPPPTKPKPRGVAEPDYPEIAKQNNWEGRVVVLARINESGEVEDASVAKSSGHS